jgi:hypothetical protein
MVALATNPAYQDLVSQNSSESGSGRSRKLHNACQIRLRNFMIG